MKKNSLKIGSTMIALATASIALSATANAFNLHRNDCFDQRRAGFRGRQMGVRNAARLFDAIWSRLGRTCNQLDRLGTIISDTPLARSTIPGEFSACFYQGYTDTLWDQLSAAYDRCQVKCFSEGSAIGEISAEGYCAASIAVGGLDDPGFLEQPPLPFCGENLVFGCKSSYIQTATSQIQGCFGFTTGSFEQTFDNSVRQDCFVPADVPIRDGRLAFADGSQFDLGGNYSIAASAW